MMLLVPVMVEVDAVPVDLCASLIRAANDSGYDVTWIRFGDPDASPNANAATLTMIVRRR